MASISDEQKFLSMNAVAGIFMCRARADMGELSLDLLHMAESIMEHDSELGVMQGCRGLLAELRFKNGDFAVARYQLEKERARFEPYDMRLWEAENHRLMALLARAEGNQPEAEEEFERALVVARAQEARWFELRAARDLARLWRDLGKTKQARDLLAPVYGWFTEGFDTADLKEAKALLDALG